MNHFLVLGEEVQAPGSETQEDQSSAPEAQQARGESEDQEAAEKRSPLLHPQICSQSLEAVSNKEIKIEDVLPLTQNHFIRVITSFLQLVTTNLKWR